MELTGPGPSQGVPSRLESKVEGSKTKLECKRMRAAFRLGFALLSAKMASLRMQGSGDEHLMIFTFIKCFKKNFNL